MRIIEVQNLHFARAHQPILADIDFAIDAGEIVTVIGPNGSGKSTLLRLLIGALQPSSGTIAIAAHARIGYVPQKLTIDVGMPIQVQRFVDTPQPQALLQQVGIAHLARRQLTSLSAGQLQRTMLARALANDPNVLILDEPTQGMDQNAIIAFYQLIHDINQRHRCAILMVSHDLHIVMRASQRVICLNRRICCQGAPTSVSSDPAYLALFGKDALETIALYRHEHDRLSAPANGDHHG